MLHDADLNGDQLPGGLVRLALGLAVVGVDADVLLGVDPALIVLPPARDLELAADLAFPIGAGPRRDTEVVPDRSLRPRLQPAPEGLPVGEGCIDRRVGRPTELDPNHDRLLPLGVVRQLEFGVDPVRGPPIEGEVADQDAEPLELNRVELRHATGVVVPDFLVGGMVPSALREDADHVVVLIQALAERPVAVAGDAVLWNLLEGARNHHQDGARCERRNRFPDGFDVAAGHLVPVPPGAEDEHLHLVRQLPAVAGLDAALQTLGHEGGDGVACGLHDHHAGAWRALAESWRLRLRRDRRGERERHEDDESDGVKELVLQGALRKASRR